MKFLTEFTEDNRNARVYYIQRQDNLAGKGKFMVLLFQSNIDYNEAKFFNNEDDANDCAEDWVLKK